MGTTDHERMLSTAFYEDIDRYPELATELARVRARIVAGNFYPQEFIDACFQKWRGDKEEVTLFDAYGFAQIWAHVLHGDAVCFTVTMPNGPGSDDNVDFNQKSLDRLPDGFRAIFTPEKGRGANDDGTLTVSAGIGGLRLILEDGVERDEPYFLPQDARIPLEVGTTQVSKTLSHLRLRRGVARWPYGCSKLLVLIGLKTSPLSSRGVT